METNYYSNCNINNTYSNGLHIYTIKNRLVNAFFEPVLKKNT